VVYWRGRTLVACNYATSARAELPPKACELLTFCDGWTTLADVRRAAFVPAASFDRVIARLVDLTLLERSNDAVDPRALAMEALRPWNPQMGFFHATTKDVRFASRETLAGLGPAQKGSPRPPAVKHYRGVPVVALRRPDGDDALARVLRARRTWRRYSPEPVALDDLATMLALSAGVQQWVLARDEKIPLKTSPSGGARHAVECYVVARAVRGLKSGVYHYAPDRHVLSRIGGRVSLARMRAYVPGSEYFADAPAMVFFTAIFARILWRYPYARAYRAALIEAGHVCQSFLLSATRLGLAPFSVMALADSVIERDLGIDGISESVLYAAGVGRPPRGTTWAPTAKGPSPKLRRNPRV
jgi:SagB-type dehydrogenase family enzyme